MLHVGRRRVWARASSRSSRSRARFRRRRDSFWRLVEIPSRFRDRARSMKCRCSKTHFALFESATRDPTLSKGNEANRVPVEQAGARTRPLTCARQRRFIRCNSRSFQIGCWKRPLLRVLERNANRYRVLGRRLASELRYGEATDSAATRDATLRALEKRDQHAASPVCEKPREETRWVSLSLLPSKGGSISLSLSIERE